MAKKKSVAKPVPTKTIGLAKTPPEMKADSQVNFRPSKRAALVAKTIQKKLAESTLDRPPSYAGVRQQAALDRFPEWMKELGLTMDDVVDDEVETS